MEPQVEDDPQLQKENKQKRLEGLLEPSAGPWKFKIVYHVAAFLIIGHIFGFYGGYLYITVAKLSTKIIAFVIFSCSMLGFTAGAHRLWCHHAYKANTPLQLLLMIFFLFTGMRSVVTWVTHHRLHHKFSDTDGDPHNASRGFFFSSVGWLGLEPHPKVVKEEKLIDVSDLLKNPIVNFQYKYIVLCTIVITYIFPIYITTLCGESLYVAIFVNYFRLLVSLTITGLINSLSHIWGYKPIDKNVVGTHFLFMGFLAFGEGFHNYHHAFPYDYRTSEIGDTNYNPAALFINLMAKIGWAYDLKMAPEDVVKSRVLKYGDGSDKYYL